MPHRFVSIRLLGALGILCQISALQIGLGVLQPVTADYDAARQPSFEPTPMRPQGNGMSRFFRRTFNRDSPSA